MSKPKLVYFDAPVSRGEECRLAFAVAGADFEDVRLKREEWAAKKPTSPYGSVPYLEVEGKGTLAQSNAILTYIGRGHGLHPTDPFEAARHEAMMENVEELRHKLAPTLFIAEETEKKKAREALAATTIPQWATHTEKHISDDGPFFAGPKLHVVDLKLHMIVRWFAGGKLDHISADIFKPFPKLTRVYEAVDAHEAVKSWRAKTA